MSNLSEKKESIVCNLFKNMNLQPAVDNNSSALSKIETYSDVSGYVDGKFITKEKRKSSDDNDYDSLISLAFESSCKGFEAWSSLSAKMRSKILFRVAQTIEKYKQLFVGLESISSGKHVHKVKTKDIPNLIESFEYYAGYILEDDSTFKAWYPIGPFCVVAEEYNNPSLSLSLRVSSILASGTSVVLIPDLKSSASALFLAEICTESGIPDGVLNVIPAEQDKINTLQKLYDFSEFFFTGSYEKGLVFSQQSYLSVIPCHVIIPRRPVVIVYENADLHSAANSVLEAFFFHDTRSKSGGCKVLVQESVCKMFLEILESHFTNILIGESSSKTDLSCAVTEEQKNILTEYIKEVKNEGKVTTLDASSANCNYTHMLPVILSGLQTSHKLVHEELGGPIIVTVPFRTVKESISMFNCDNKGSPVSIWTEKISVAIEVALKLKSGVVWVNSENVIDPRTAFTGIYSSGNSVVGGKDAFFSHFFLPETPEIDEDKNSSKDVQESCGMKILVFTVPGTVDDRDEYQLYIGGNFKRSDNGTTVLNENTLIPAGTESDVQSAILSAISAQPKWEAMTEPQKRKIIFNMISQLRMAKNQFVDELQKISGNSLEVCETEFANTLDFLHYWASQSEKFSGSMQEIKKNFIVIQNRNPLGVIGIQCPDEKPLLSFVSLVIPPLLFGNTIVAVTSAEHPTLALKMCQIFTLSNVPGGVINVVCGNVSRLISALCKHKDVNSIWYSDLPPKYVFPYCRISQRIFSSQDIWNEFNGAKALKYTMESTFNKSIFLPAGEIFAN